MAKITAEKETSEVIDERDAAAAEEAHESAPFCPAVDKMHLAQVRKMAALKRVREAFAPARNRADKVGDDAN